jgi:hypothetical protein
LPNRTADPASVVAAWGGERPGRDTTTEVEHGGDLRWVSSRRGRGVVDARAGLTVARTEPVGAAGRNPTVG